MRTLYVVVARGRDAGQRLRVEEAVRVVGRGRDADLVLGDARVSRRHLRVRMSEAGVHVETCEGAIPFLVGGTPRTEADLRVGETLVVGDTALVVTQDASVSSPGGAHTTQVRALMTGLAADVRGLAAAMDLVDALDAAADEAAIGGALKSWGEKYVQAVDASLLVGDAVPEDLRAPEAGKPNVVERAADDPSCSILIAPAFGSDVAWISFTCKLPLGAVTDTLRRLVAVAGRMSASTLARMRSLQQSEQDRDLFRRASVGSARSFLGDSPAAREVGKLVGRLAASDVVVLLEGETGVGKTFLARLLHESGERAKAPFRVINCAAIPDTLIESELFGHERGAFSGATSARPGALESAGKGTVLLDEIGELPLASQAKLLRVLEEKRFERLGSNRPITLDARVITATNRDLAAMVEKGTFRQDLFYRIAVMKLRVPALRERGEDLPLLAARMLADLAASAGRRVEGFTPAALAAIVRYPWPGNVRELRNAIERALVVGESVRIDVGDFPESMTASTPPQPSDESLVRLPAKLDWLELRAIHAALRASGDNQRQAALLLGIDRGTLRRKLRASTGEAGGEDD